MKSLRMAGTPSGASAAAASRRCSSEPSKRVGSVSTETAAAPARRVGARRGRANRGRRRASAPVRGGAQLELGNDVESARHSLQRRRRRDLGCAPLERRKRLAPPRLRDALRARSAISSKKPLTCALRPARRIARSRASQSAARPLSRVVARACRSPPQSRRRGRRCSRASPHCSASAARCGPRSRRSNTARRAAQFAAASPPLRSSGRHGGNPNSRGSTFKAPHRARRHVVGRERVRWASPHPNRRRRAPPRRARPVMPGQGLRHQLRRGFIVGADQLIARRGRVGQRSEQIEDRAHAERGARWARGPSSPGENRARTKR